MEFNEICPKISSFYVGMDRAFFDSFFCLISFYYITKSLSYERCDYVRYRKNEKNIF